MVTVHVADLGTQKADRIVEAVDENMEIALPHVTDHGRTTRRPVIGKRSEADLGWSHLLENILGRQLDVHEPLALSKVQSHCRDQKPRHVLAHDAEAEMQFRARRCSRQSHLLLKSLRQLPIHDRRQKSVSRSRVQHHSSSTSSGVDGEIVCGQLQLPLADAEALQTQVVEARTLGILDQRQILHARNAGSCRFSEPQKAAVVMLSSAQAVGELVAVELADLRGEREPAPSEAQQSCLEVAEAAALASQHEGRRRHLRVAHIRDRDRIHNSTLR